MAKKIEPWGRLASVDLHNVDLKLIKNPKQIRSYVRMLCKLIKMHRVGPTEIKRFGYAKLRGYSMHQFIETSMISAHFDETGKRAFIDIFSCKNFNPKTVAVFSKKFFKAKNYTLYKETRR